MSRKHVWLTPDLESEGYYEVSDQGRVRGVARLVTRDDPRRGFVTQPVTEKLLAQSKRNSRLSVMLSKNGRHERVIIHRLVLETFIGPCPPGMQCCHANDDPEDNRLSNLRWDTAAANRDDCVRNGHHHNAKKTHCKRGHKFDEANTWIQVKPNGRIGRICRSCQRHRYRARKNDTHVV